jgi:hypothetical protein
VVTYTSTQLGTLPSSFPFESRIIMTANTVPQKNDAFRAVLSRIDVFELSATNAEVVELMQAVAGRGYAGLTPAECLAVVDFIDRHADGRQLSLRLLEPSFKKVLFARAEGLPWEPLVRSQLHTLGLRRAVVAAADPKAHELLRLREAVERHPDSVKDQQAYWCKATGKSRATFFRTLTRHRNNSR